MTAPAWWSSLQADLAGAITAPLDRSSGTLITRSDRYEGALVDALVGSVTASARERLAIYNRQYWCRLFSVLQQSYPLVTRLVGEWAFNGLAAKFFSDNPPRTADLYDATVGFDRFLAQPDVARGLPEGDAIAEAATVDAAWLWASSAPDEPAWAPSSDDAASLPERRFRWRSGVTLVEEHWAWMPLRAKVTSLGDAPLRPPERLAARQAWIVAPSPFGPGPVPVVPLQAKLFHRMATEPLAVALAAIEGEATADERARLPELVQRWLAQSVALRFWSARQCSAPIASSNNPPAPTR